jgi:toxin YoeB
LTLQNQDKKILKKINEILKVLSRGGQIAKVENLKYQLSGYQSARIDDKNRLIFKIDNNANEIEVLSCIGHYQDN